LVLTGKLGVLERLRGHADPVTLLSSVTGIGKRLAERLHDELGIETLEQLEAAAHDGRLADAGIGPKRLRGIIDFLTMRLSRLRRTFSPSAVNTPSVEELLDVDREYREKVAAGVLRRIAPRRFNPQQETWLPVLHTQRGQRLYTALFSNTARAHQFGKTRDWVVLYYDDGNVEQQCTIITSQRGVLSGHRIVRGRETECEEYYRIHAPLAIGAEVLGHPLDDSRVLVHARPQ
jgi:putative hydrolase